MIWLIFAQGPKVKLAVPYEGADHAIAATACPLCGTKELRVAGRNVRASVDDRAWEADGYALCCKVALGLVRYETNTLFGVREDMAVLGGRCRVY